MHVEIVEKKVDRREFVNRETGEARQIVTQNAYLHFEEMPYPTPFKLSLDEHSDGYEKGKYQFAPNSFTTDKYGKLSFAFQVDLIPSSVSALKAAS